MDDISLNLVLGVAAGLFTTLVLFICKAIAYEIVLPWLRKAMYQDICLDGTWYKHDKYQKLVIELKQDTNRIKGKATVVANEVTKPEEYREDMCLDDVRTFDIEGKICNGFVTLTMYHTSKQRLGLHTYLLKVSADGSKLNGESSWYAPLAETINSGSIQFFRNEKVAINALIKSEGPIQSSPEEDS